MNLFDHNAIIGAQAPATGRGIAESILHGSCARSICRRLAFSG
jgi:hypothetical protein